MKSVKKKSSNVAKPSPKANDSFFVARSCTSILCLFFSVFITVALMVPDRTGLLGPAVIIGAQWIVGKAVYVVPVYCLAAAAVCIVNHYRQRRVPFLGLGISLWCVSVLTASIFTAEQPVWSTETLINGGGVLGFLGYRLLSNIMGVYGMWIILVGLMLASIVMIAYVSLADLIIALKHGCIRLGRGCGWVFESMALGVMGNRSESATASSPVIPTTKKRTVHVDPVDYVALNTPEKDPVSVVDAEVVSESNHSVDEPDRFLPTIIEPKELMLSEPVILTPPVSTIDYEYPPLSLLDDAPTKKKESDEVLQERQERAKMLEHALQSFHVDAVVVNITPGPSVTRYELKPGVGVKISKITGLANDIALKLAASDVRIEAPIPGKSLIGIEVPNITVDPVNVRRLIDGSVFMTEESKLIACMGLTITGDPILMDLAKMPHVLIAGATGSGKSVCVNAIIMSILMRATPDEVKFLMIDPKKVELNLYEGIPHLCAPVVTDPHQAAATLKKWALKEMEDRYEIFSKLGVKHISGFNAKIDEINNQYQSDPEAAKAILEEQLDYDVTIEDFRLPEKLPYIVVVIDELADLMMVASQDVENTICRLAQMSRATGIHLVIATQRPSVNVVTGLIKANVPSRVSFFLQSQIDSRTILDTGGAEKLLGKGDMLYMPVGAFKPLRVQGVFVSESEVKKVVKFWKNQAEPTYVNDILDVEVDSQDKTESGPDGTDDLFAQAKEIVQSTQYASTSYLQRKLRIGYNRAARIMDELEDHQVISAYDAESKSRHVL